MRILEQIEADYPGKEPQNSPQKAVIKAVIDLKTV
jgi:hypothetical protein